MAGSNDELAGWLLTPSTVAACSIVLILVQYHINGSMPCEAAGVVPLHSKARVRRGRRDCVRAANVLLPPFPRLRRDPFFYLTTPPHHSPLVVKGIWTNHIPALARWIGSARLPNTRGSAASSVGSRMPSPHPSVDPIRLFRAIGSGRHTGMQIGGHRLLLLLLLLYTGSRRLRWYPPRRGRCSA